MSDLLYNVVLYSCYPAFWVSGQPVVLHRERIAQPGGLILAPNHLSPYDVACLMSESPRKLDWVSVVEVFRNPVVALIYGSINVFPLDRSRPDSPTVRIILDRLKRGRIVAMFPEGGIRDEKNSVLAGGPFKPGVARIAQLAGVPVMPCVVLGTKAYKKFRSWYPLRRTEYGINFGQPLSVRTDVDKATAVKLLLDEMRAAYLALADELRAAMRTGGSGG